MSIDIRDDYKCGACGKLYSDICQDSSYMCTDCKQAERNKDLYNMLVDFVRDIYEVYSYEESAEWRSAKDILKKLGELE